jgi:hypothetical protein
MLIGIVGFIGAGKDTVADYLVNFHEFRRESFASTLKDSISSIFGWDRTLLEGRTKEAREWRESVDHWWADRLNMPTLTPRWILQYWGTDVCRAQFHNDIWIASLENKIRNSADNIVISDCRFPNEIAAVQNGGGKIFWVQRGPLPIWYDTAISANRGNIQDINQLNELKVHQSETAWVGTAYDKIIDNNGPISDLYENVLASIKISN